MIRAPSIRSRTYLARQVPGYLTDVVRAQRALVLRDTAEIRVLADKLRGGDFRMARRVVDLAMMADQLKAAEPLLAAVSAAARTRRDRASAHRMRAVYEAARGRWPSARSALEAASSLDSIAALYRRAHLLTLPAASGSTAELRTLRSVLRQVHDTTRVEERAHVLQLLHVALRDAAALEQQAAESDGDTRAYAAARAKVLRGDSAGALRLLDRYEGYTEFPRNQLLHAQLLAAAQRYDEAAAWFAAAREMPHALHFRGYTYLLEVEMHERAKRRPVAQKLRARAARLTAP